MLFKKIKLNNFGRYYGHNTIDVTVTPDRNVILVKGNNDRGKSTFFHAIRFALYGENGLPVINGQREKVQRWINYQRAAESDDEMYVSILFEHEGYEYNVKRSIKFRKSEKGKTISVKGEPRLKVTSNGSIPNPDDLWLDAQLPYDVSQFFFFDGEDIQSYVQHEKPAVKKAIRKVLGMLELDNAAEDLENLSDKLGAERLKRIRESRKYQRALNKLSNDRKNLEEIQNYIKDQEIIRNGAEREKEDCRKMLERYNTITEMVRKRSQLEQGCQNLEIEIKENTGSLNKMRGNLGFILMSELLRIITSSSYTPHAKIESEIAKRIIDNKMEMCICDRPIDDHVRSILYEKKSSFSKEFEVEELARRLYSLKPDEKWSTLKSELDKKYRLEQEIDTIKSKIKDTSEKIHQNKHDDIEKLEKRRDDAIGHIREAELVIERLSNQGKKLEAQIKSDNEKLTANTTDVNIKSIEDRQKKCAIISACMKDAADLYYKKVKSSLEEMVSDAFTRLTNNPDLYRGICFSDDFGIKIVRDDNTMLPSRMYSPSAGASQIVAISLIAGLNRFTTRDAPVVADTPAGRLDPTHRERTAKFYSGIGKQVIILYQPSELTSSDIENIRYNIASEWEVSSVGEHPDRSCFIEKVRNV